jgi:hypothetical protein
MRSCVIWLTDQARTENAGINGVHKVPQTLIGHSAHRDVHRSAGTFDTKWDADHAWKLAEGRVADHTWIELSKGKITFAAFVDEVYWPLYAAVREPSTRAGYHHMLERNLRPAFGAMSLRSITAEVIQRFAIDLGRMVSPSTVRKNVMLLSKILNTAVKTRRINVTSAPASSWPRFRSGSCRW